MSPDKKHDPTMKINLMQAKPGHGPAPAAPGPAPAVSATESASPPLSTVSDPEISSLLQAGAIDPPDVPGMLGQLDRFTLIRVLGRGGMGQVFLAFEPVTKGQVAIKMILQEFINSSRTVHAFLNEARHMYKMSHPNILKVMEVSEVSNRPYYVMPYIPNGSLADQIKTDTKLSPDFILNVARQVAGALRYAHERGIIHRDIKPANILIDEGCNTYLTDFGLVRTVFNDSMIDVQRQQIVGTPAYMSPSVAEGKVEDTRCDIYAFGCLMYEMLTGCPPYVASNPHVIIEQVLHGPPIPILKHNPFANKDLVKIAEAAMARNLRDRYAEMADVAADLDRVAAGKPPKGAHGGTGSKINWSLITRVAAGLLITALVFTGGGLAVRALLHKKQPARQEISTSVTNLRQGSVKAPSPVGTWYAGNEKDWDGTVVIDERMKCDCAGNPGDVVLNTNGTFDVSLADGWKHLGMTWVEEKKSFIGKHVKPDGSVMAIMKYSMSSDYGLTKEDLEYKKAFDAEVKRTHPGKDITSVLKRRPDGLYLFIGSEQQPAKDFFDLSAIRKIPVLWSLDISFTQVTDLSPLRDIQLACLCMRNTSITNLHPLEGMKLWMLNATGSTVSDISPLRGMPLGNLNLVNCIQLNDLSPLAGMRQLGDLWIAGSSVKDLTPLHGLSLRALTIENTPITDLTPLEGMSLEAFSFNPNKITKGLEVVRGMKTINELSIRGAGGYWISPDEFWKKYDLDGKYLKK